MLIQFALLPQLVLFEQPFVELVLFGRRDCGLFLNLEWIFIFVHFLHVYLFGLSKFYPLLIKVIGTV